MWAAFLSRVSVGGALPVWFEPSDVDASGAECCRVTMQVPCVKGDVDVRISRSLVLPQWSSDADAAEWARDQVRWFYRHEADEQVRVDGVAVFEPREEHR